MSDSASSATPVDRLVIKPDATLQVPPEVQLCPYCGERLEVQFSGWCMDDEGFWITDCLELECKAMPDVSEEEWEAEMERHSQYPYIYWLPADQVVTAWVNANYRFDMA